MSLELRNSPTTWFSVSTLHTMQAFSQCRELWGAHVNGKKKRYDLSRPIKDTKTALFGFREKAHSQSVAHSHVLTQILSCYLFCANHRYVGLCRATERIKQQGIKKKKEKKLYSKWIELTMLRNWEKTERKLLCSY